MDLIFVNIRLNLLELTILKSNPELQKEYFHLLDQVYSSLVDLPQYSKTNLQQSVNHTAQLMDDLESHKRNLLLRLGIDE